MSWSRAKVTNESRLKERECPYCKRFMDRSFLEERLTEIRESKSKHMKEAIQLRKDNGEAVGRPRLQIDESLAIKLRRQGLSLRRISQEMGIEHNLI